MKFVLHLHSRGKEWYLMRTTGKEANREIRYKHDGRKRGIRFTTDRRMSRKFASYDAAKRHWSRLVRVHSIRGWVVSPIPV